ncbi:MAG: hypothetical protein R6W70_09305 [bacterium]
MKIKTVLFATANLLLIFFITSACGASVEDKELLVINFSYEDDGSCEVYGSNLNYNIELYDSQHILTEKFTDFTCEKDGDSVEINVPEGKYFITTELRDSSGNTKTYGESVTSVLNATEETISMGTYKGGMELEWSKSICEDMAVSVLFFTIIKDDEPVKTNIWGEETTIENYKLNCNAGNLLVKNITDGNYEITVTGYRDSDSEIPRISLMDKETRKVTPGQDTEVTLKDPDILVSDLKIVWEFDSKRNDSCETAGISSLRASITEDTSTGETITRNFPCNVTENEFVFYDIQSGDYGVSMVGLSGDSELFQSVVDNPDKSDNIITVEKGHVGVNAREVHIFLVEKE